MSNKQGVKSPKGGKMRVIAVILAVLSVASMVSAQDEVVEEPIPAPMVKAIVQAVSGKKAEAQNMTGKGSHPCEACTKARGEIVDLQNAVAALRGELERLQAIAIDMDKRIRESRKLVGKALVTLDP